MAYSTPEITDLDTLVGMAWMGREGRHWYREAWCQVVAGARILNTPPSRFADLLALFSPRVDVMRSVRHAIHYARHGTTPPGTLRSVEATVRHWEGTGVIRGPKSAAFARALQGCEESVVLDVWMAQALGVQQKQLGAKALREYATERITAAAAALGWTPAQTQAAIWGRTLVLAGRNPPAMLIEPEFPLPPF